MSSVEADGRVKGAGISTRSERLDADGDGVAIMDADNSEQVPKTWSEELRCLLRTAMPLALFYVCGTGFGVLTVATVVCCSFD